MIEGEKVKLIKKTFIHQGVFILTNSVVEIVEVSEDGIAVVYNDKEGNPHVIKNLQATDLAPL
ncbi:MAG: hypothetical protein SFU98_21020 [Leptospiraceae bacterium]|nr:hypothetical protein [Leptospiraceae bacterium]